MDNIAQQYNRIVEQMLDYVENTRTDQAEAPMEVPVSAYTDSTVFQREMDLIFKRLPLMVGLSAELPKPGDFKTIEVLDKPLLITRQADGSVRAMLNVCTHRGMLLVDKPCGNRRLFTCPYHAWSFSNDGALRAVSEPEKFGDVDKATHGLTQLPVYERAGLIFAVLTPGLEVDFAGFLGGMIEDVERLGFKDWYYCGQREIFGASWKVAYDGYLEGYHFAAAHPHTIHPRTVSNVMEFRAHGPHVLIGFPGQDIAKLREVPRSELHKHENDGFDFVRTIFPCVSIFVAPEITQIAQLIPGPKPGENRTILYFVNRETPRDEAQKAELEKMMDWLRTVVDQEDYQVGLKVQRGLEAGAYEHVVFGRNERGNQYFHNWVKWYLANDPSAPKPVL